MSNNLPKSRSRRRIIIRKTAKQLGLKRYFTGLPCSAGHICERQTSTGHCVICNLERVKREYKNPRVQKRIKAWRKRWYAANIKQSSEKSRKWYAQNKEYRHKYYLKRRHIQRVVARKRNAERLKTDILFRIKRALMSRFGRVPQERRAGTTNACIQNLGCSLAELKTYMENKFSDKMNWQNWTTFWQFDHMKPLSQFDLTKSKQLRKACHYTNLQPLLIIDHREKTAKELRER